MTIPPWEHGNCDEVCSNSNCSTVYCRLSPFGKIRITNTASYPLSFYLGHNYQSGIRYEYELNGRHVEDFYGITHLDSQGNCGASDVKLSLASGETAVFCVVTMFRNGGYDKTTNPRIVPSAELAFMQVSKENSYEMVDCPYKPYSVSVSPTNWREHSK